MNDSLPERISIGEKYGPAMAMTDPHEAAAYFERCVQHTMAWIVRDGRSTTPEADRAEAERIERANLGYYAGYYDSATRERVERLFRCSHPIFGAIAERGAPTLQEGFDAGRNRAKAQMPRDTTAPIRGSV